MFICYDTNNVETVHRLMDLFAENYKWQYMSIYKLDLFEMKYKDLSYELKTAISLN